MTEQQLLNRALYNVEILNSECHFDGSIEHYTPFSFEYHGWQNGLIRFMGVILWTTENDERGYIEDTDIKEDLYTFLKKESEKITVDLTKKVNNTNVDILTQFASYLEEYDITGVDDILVNEFLNGYYE